MKELSGGILMTVLVNTSLNAGNSDPFLVPFRECISACVIRAIFGLLLAKSGASDHIRLHKTMNSGT
jgi:hypothetical protein